MTLRIRLRYHGPRATQLPGSLDVPPGIRVREVLGRLGLPAEGHVCWWKGSPCPLDEILDSEGELEIVSSFSGG